jgi:AcrR family transcriptional regulator
MPRVIPTYKEDAKRKIIQEALAEFKEKGYFQSTMDGIAKRLGVSHGTIYQYFPSKEDLFAAVYSGGPENLRTMISGKSVQDFLEQPDEVFGKMATRANALLFVEFLAEASRNPAFQKIARDNIKQFNIVIQDMIKPRKGVKQSKEDIEKFNNTAIALGLLFNGMLLWLAAGVPEAEVRKTWADLLKVILGPLLKSN